MTERVKRSGPAAVLIALAINVLTSVLSPIHASAGYVRAPIHGKSIDVYNVSSASDDRATEMVNYLDDILTNDGPVGPANGMLQTNDIVLITNRYLVWIDMTPTNGGGYADRFSGGLMEGLWSLYGRDNLLWFRDVDPAKDGAWNELAPSPSAPGAQGLSLMANMVKSGEDCQTLPRCASAAAYEPAATATRIVYNSGRSVRVEVKGHFWWEVPDKKDPTKAVLTMDLNPNEPNTQSLEYRVVYDLSRHSSDINMETHYRRDGSPGDVGVSMLTATSFDTPSKWTAPYTYSTTRNRANRISGADVERHYEGESWTGAPIANVGKGTEVDIPNDIVRSLSWWERIAPGTGMYWYMREFDPAGDMYPDRTLVVRALDDPSGGRIQQQLHVYTPSANAYSIGWDAIKVVGVLQPLGTTYAYSYRYRLSTRPPTTHFSKNAPHEWHSAAAPAGEQPVVGDFSGDGQDDIAWHKPFASPNQSDGQVFLAIAQDNGGFGPTSEPLPSFPSGILRTGDVNADGRDDLVVFRQAPDGQGAAPVYVALSTGSGFAAQPVAWHSLFSLSGELPLVGDISGDGKADIVTVASGNVWRGISDGVGRFESAVALHNWPCTAQGGKARLGDFTGDAAAVPGSLYPVDDMVCVAPDRAVWVARSTGGSAPELQDTGIWSSAGPEGREEIRVGDVDGDGDGDLVTFYRGAGPTGLNGDVRIWRSNRSAPLAPMETWQDYFCEGQQACDVGDATGDWRADVIAFEQRTSPTWTGSLVWVGRAQ